MRAVCTRHCSDDAQRGGWPAASVRDSGGSCLRNDELRAAAQSARGALARDEAGERARDRERVVRQARVDEAPPLEPLPLAAPSTTS